MEYRYKIIKADLLYPELSYKINGVLFEVFKKLGSGLLERQYEKAAAIGFKDLGIKFEEQYSVPIYFKDKFIGTRRLDFLVENLIIVELKRGKFIPGQTISQTLD